MRSLAAIALLCAGTAFAGAGTVTELEGAAYRTPKGAAAPVALKLGAAVEVGDTLEVAPGGTLAVTLTDKSVIALDEGSRLQLDEARFGEQGSTIFSAKLLLGSLWAKVTKLTAGSQAKFEVTTERGVAGVRGTVFTVDLGAGQDANLEVGVEEGEVEVAHAVLEEQQRVAVAAAPRPSSFDEPSGAGRVPPLAQAQRFPNLERVTAGHAIVFGPKALARHRFELRRPRLAAFIGKHRERWLRLAVERERDRAPLKERRERRQERLRR